MTPYSRHFNYFVAGVIVIIAGILVLGYLTFAKGYFSDSTYVVPQYGNVGLLGTSTNSIAPSPQKVVSHLPTPKPVRAFYMTSWVASTPSLRAHVIKLAEDTEINAIVIDVKDDTGHVVFLDDNEVIQKVGSAQNRVRDLADLIDQLHQKNIYVIARIATFQDPYLAKTRPDLAVLWAKDGAVWKDRKGLSWVDPGSREVWEYVTTIGKEAYNLGFDEVNYDYVRFPSDGDLRNLSYPHSNLASTTKPAVIKSFFTYVHDTLKPLGIPLSADLFGMTTTATDDMNIGQVFENALPYFDYIDPMVYPSHYPPHFHGYPDPNKVPYEIVKYAMDSAVARAQTASTSIDKIRPWLQDFDYPVHYTAADVEAQKKAVYDAGLSSWLMWDPSNQYTKEAYEVNPVAISSQ